MASPEPPADVAPPGDLSIAHPVELVLFVDIPAYERASRQVAQLGYDQIRLDATGWSSVPEIYDALAIGVGSPKTPGRDLKALDDCLLAVANRGYGWSATATGLAVSIEHFDALVAVDPDLARQLAGIATAQVMRAKVLDNHIMWLFQVDNLLDLGVLAVDRRS